MTKNIKHIIAKNNIYFCCHGFFWGLGLPHRGQGEQSLQALIFPAPCPRTASASGGTRRLSAFVARVVSFAQRKSRSGWKLKAVFIDAWFANLRMFSTDQSSMLVALACRTSHLNSIKQGHSLSMWEREHGIVLWSITPNMEP